MQSMLKPVVTAEQAWHLLEEKVKCRYKSVKVSAAAARGEEFARARARARAGGSVRACARGPARRPGPRPGAARGRATSAASARPQQNGGSKGRPPLTAPPPRPYLPARAGRLRQVGRELRRRDLGQGVPQRA